MTVSPSEPLELPATLEPDNPLWRYALTCWQRSELAQRCLDLQSGGWSVTRILCAAWLGVNGRVFTGNEDAKVTEWRDRVTGPLRRARKSIPRDHSQCQPLREALASVELQAEQTELALAWQSITTFNPKSGTMQDPDTAILQNLSAAAPCPRLAPSEAECLQRLASLFAQIPAGDALPCS